MNLRQALINNHSKESAVRIAAYIGKNPDHFSELMQHIFSPEYRLSQHAAFVFMQHFDAYPKMVQPYISQIIERLAEPDLKIHLKRNFVRILQFVEIPQSQMGGLVNRCFGFLENPKEAIAVRVFSMTVLYNISKRHPELQSELQLLIEQVLQEPTVSAGIHNRGKKTLAQLNC